MTPVTLSVQSDTHSSVADARACLGGEADAGIPAISLSIGSPLHIINLWDYSPQLPGKVGDAAGNVAVVVAPDLPCQLQVVPFDIFFDINIAALIQKSLHRRRQVDNISQDLFTSGRITKFPFGFQITKS